MFRLYEMKFLASAIEEEYFPTYSVSLYGVNDAGKQICCRVHGIKVFCDIFAGKQTQLVSTQLETFRKKDRSSESLVIRSKIVKRKHFSSFSKPEPVVRAYFANPFDMSATIKLLQEWNKSLRFAHETTNSYFNVLSRDYSLPLFDWLEVDSLKYEIVERERLSTRADSTPIVTTISVDIKDLKRTSPSRDKSLVLYWDTETYNGPSGSPCVLENLVNKDVNYDIEIISIGAVFAYSGDRVPLEKYVFTSHPVLSFSNITGKSLEHTNVVAEDERGMILNYLDVVKRHKPSIVCGFNDSGFDWPLLIRRCAYLDILRQLFTAFSWDHKVVFNEINFWRRMCVPKNILGPNHPAKDRASQPIKFKLENSISLDLCLPKFPGVVCVDLMPILRKANLKENYSLNTFLALDKFDVKLSIDFTVLWKHFVRVRQDPTDKEAIDFLTYNTEYCLYDTIACMLLLNSRNIIGIRREFANYSFVTLADAIYRADSMKVENLVFYTAEQRGYSCTTEPPRKSMTPQEKRDADKQQGAFCACFIPGRDGAVRKVAVPRPGKSDKIVEIRVERPATEFDFSSLYPSIAMTINLSPETITTNADDLKDEQFYEFEFETKFGVKQCGYALDDGMDESKKGILPLVFIYLYAERVKIREQGGPFADIVEQYEADYKKDHPLPNGKNERIKHAREMYARLCENEEYKDSKRMMEMLDGKQLAVKILLNTIYGATGAATSKIYNPLITGAITHYGRLNVQMTSRFAEANGYRTAYIDTDSNYVIAPESLFSEIDIEFAAGRLTRRQWERKMVELAFHDACFNYYPRLREMIHRENRGKKYLNMEVGKVLYPYLYAKKKMYHGVHHNGNPKTGEISFNENFADPEHWTVKGMSMTRQDTTPFVKKVGLEMLSELYENWEMTVEEIVRKCLSEIYTSADRYDVNLFTKTVQWRPNKQNATVVRFVERMQARYRSLVAQGKLDEAEFSRPPDPNSKFAIVITEPESRLSLKGTKIKANVGEKAEYPRTAEYYGMQVDRGYYFEKFHAVCEQQLTYLFAGSTDKVVKASTKKLVIDHVKSLTGSGNNASERSAFKVMHKRLTARCSADLRPFATILQVLLKYPEDLRHAANLLLMAYERWPMGYRRHYPAGFKPQDYPVTCNWVEAQRQLVIEALAKLVSGLRRRLREPEPFDRDLWQTTFDLHISLLKVCYVTGHGTTQAD
jgi:DNA polymerase elongation subunit (family B)